MNADKLKLRAKQIIESIDSCKYKPSDPVAWIIEDYKFTTEYDSCDNDVLSYYYPEAAECYYGKDEDDIMLQILDLHHLRKPHAMHEYSNDEEEEIAEAREANVSLLDDIEADGVWGRMEHKIDQQYAYTFLTKEAAESFLNANGYHFHEKARVYSTIFWRNNEMNDVINIIREFSK